MSMNLQPESGHYRTRVVLTPSQRQTEQLRELGELQPQPDGVELSPHYFQGGKVAPGQTDKPFQGDSSQVPASRFSPEELARESAQAEGPGRVTDLATQSGIRGQVLETSQGMRYKLVLPEGVLPEPVVLEHTCEGLQAHNLDGSKSFPASQEGSRVQVQLGSQGTLAVFDEKSYDYGLLSPSKVEHDDVKMVTRDCPFTMPFGDGTYQEPEGTRESRRNLEEWVSPAGQRTIIADRHHLESFREASEDYTESYYRIQDGRTPKAEFVVEGRDVFHHFEAPWDKLATDRHAVSVSRTPDGGFDLRPGGGLQEFGYAVGNRLRNLGSRYFVKEQLQVSQADETLVRPFSAMPPQDRV